MQEMWVRSVVPEDPTHPGATKHVHNYWACAPEPRNHNYWAYVLQLLKSVHPRAHASRARSHHSEKPTNGNSSPHSLQLEKNLHSNEVPAQPEIN